MATFVFDTHRAVKALAAAGFPEAQAEALVEIVGAAVGENAATKADVDAAERRMEARIEALEERMMARITASEERMMARITASEERTEARFTSLEERMESRLVSLEQRITLRFLLILLPSLGLLFAALRYLPG